MPRNAFFLLGPWCVVIGMDRVATDCLIRSATIILYLLPFILLMFKKDPQPKASASIKSSERRKLLQSICSTYNLPQDKMSKEALVALLPMNTKQATFKSVQGYSGTIYCDDNETPTWFKSRDSKIYPSLYTLWKCPYVLPVIKTHPHVIGILAGGADLMLPGTIPPFDNRAIRGAIVGIVDSEHPTVVKAIGQCRMNMTQFDRVIGKTGICVEVLHHLDDELYKLNKYVDIAIPEELDTNVPLDTGKSDETEQEQPETEKGEEEETQVESQPPIDTSISEPLSKLQVVEDKHSDSDDDTVTLTVDEIDNFFTRSLFQTIKTDTLAFPILASTFMSQHIYKNLPIIESSYCNIKKTSWKKTAKFLRAMDKLGYLEIRGKDDNMLIVSVKQNSDIIKNFVTHKTMGSKSSGDKAPTPSKKAHELSIINYFKPTSKSRVIFNKLDMSFSMFYQANELRAMLDKYIKLQDLVNVKNPKTVKVDDNLKAVTNLGPEATPRDTLFKAFLNNFSPYYQIVKPGESPEKAEIHKGQPSKILIITETKIGRKIVTKVTNFETFYIKAHILSEELKVKCSGSSTIAPCVQNPKLTEVTVQGPHGKLIIDLFKDKGVPISFIDFQDKVKKKKKKTT